MSGPAIRCDRLSRWYGEVQGLSGLTVDIDEGVVGLLGPNGSGKTTFMRLITGLIKPTRGSVELFGQRVHSGAHEIYRDIGYAPGDDIHFEAERAIDFLCMMARVSGSNAREAREQADEALRRVEMNEVAHKRLNAMSKGMRQRIKVAQALLFRPRLLLLDEPLNGMDPLSRRRVMDLVRTHGAEGGTVVFASHVLHEVEAVTDQVLMLHHGRLLAEGKLAEIRALLDVKPRRVTVRGSANHDLAARMLDANLVTGVAFGSDDLLYLDTRSLKELISALQEVGADGKVESLEIDDEKLEAVFDLLVGGEA